MNEIFVKKVASLGWNDFLSIFEEKLNWTPSWKFFGGHFSKNKSKKVNFQKRHYLKKPITKYFNFLPHFYKY
jgi:hypothetical protein